jgi:O-antigen/teichoic acid export membrane protein
MMLKQVSGTVLARIIMTAMGLLVSVIAGHRLGTAGLGTIGLIVLGITLVRLGTDLMGGGALVYLVPRVPLGRLLRPSYIWALATSAMGFAVVYLLKLVPEGFAADVAVLAFLQGMNAIHLGVLLGQQRIRANNLVSVSQAVVLVAVFAWLSARPGADARSFVEASYAAVAVALLLGAWAMRKRTPTTLAAPEGILRMLLRQGAYVQAANGLQLLNYRLAYWLIEKFRDTATLGIYTVANQLAEGSWLVPKSLAVVLYSKVSNLRHGDMQRLLTLSFLKLSVTCAAAVVVVLLLLPGTVFQWLFGPEVTGITPLIAWLAPGILAMAATQAFSHFFSGTARNVHNVMGSGLGLCAAITAGFLLIPSHGLVGAAISASLAYVANAGYQAIAFMRITSTPVRDFLPGRADGRRMMELLKPRGKG